MSGSEAYQPSSSRRSAPRRVFTLDEANRTLPLVRRIVTDIVNEYRLLNQLIEQADQSPGEHGTDATERQRAARAEVQRLNELIEELQGIGCELKDWETGLVDFRAERCGEVVYLCWRLGEDDISHWHELHAGMAGRRPVDDGFSLAPAAPARTHVAAVRRR